LLHGEYILVIPVIILTLNCLKLAKESDKEWKRAFDWVLEELEEQKKNDKNGDTDNGDGESGRNKT
jgi:hypothetical protein